MPTYVHVEILCVKTKSYACIYVCVQQLRDLFVGTFLSQTDSHSNTITVHGSERFLVVLLCLDCDFTQPISGDRKHTCRFESVARIRGQRTVLSTVAWSIAFGRSSPAPSTEFPVYPKNVPITRRRYPFGTGKYWSISIDFHKCLQRIKTVGEASDGSESTDTLILKDSFCDCGW